MMVKQFLSVECSDSHSLRYYFSGVSAPGYGLPEFYKVGYVDDQQIDVYSSDNRRSIPVAPWLKKNERPEHWDTITDIAKEHETLFKDEVKIGMRDSTTPEGSENLELLPEEVVMANSVEGLKRGLDVFLEQNNIVSYSY
ncbi:unnamed protein product [Ranitomeya imitator]|uniref:MHC class I-like antigen recognition-like domain-containing protein n=1 Tax=Ranitomeya imitator TaxID=111125 RepID=A0ABN9LX10_9NEOB|nr:unnamed protein product [Ranitomeya imitator]